MNKISRRRLLGGLPATLGATTALGLAFGSVTAYAQATKPWPARTLRIIVAYPPGGVSDQVSRLLADRLAIALGVPVIVDNKGGAGGTLGMDAAAKAPPDGHVFGFSAISPLALSPHLNRLPYDAARDIVPVVSVMYSPVLLLATPATDAKDFAALVAAAKAKPGSVRWATSGIASIGHIMLEQVRARSGADLVHVPYKGGGQPITDAVSGQFELLSSNASGPLLQQVKAGKLRVLAVGAPARLESAPDAPTLGELGYPAANLTSLFGLFAPAKTPPEVVERFNAEVNKVLAMPEVRTRLQASDNVPTGGSAAEFARLIAAESDNNAKIIKAAGIKAE